MLKHRRGHRALIFPFIHAINLRQFLLYKAHSRQQVFIIQDYCICAIGKNHYLCHYFNTIRQQVG